MDDAHHKLRLLVTRHCAALGTNVELLTRFVALTLDGSDENGESGRDALALCHQIGASSLALGFDQLSAAASYLERALEPVVAVNGVPGPIQRARVVTQIAAMKLAVRELRPEACHLFRQPVAVPLRLQA